MTINLATIDFCPGQGGGGGEAVWGGITGNINRQTDLMNKFAGYTTPNDFKTINNESIVGSGNIEVGGLDPEQEAAVDVLTDSSEGLLYTDEYGSQKTKILNGNFDGSYFEPNYCFNVGNNDIYYLYNTRLCKYNKDTLSFDFIKSFNSTVNMILWIDASGRIYDGPNYQLDIQNGTEIYLDTYASNYYYTNNRNNIFNGEYGVWLVSDYPQKFNETTQKFESGYTVTGSDGNLYSEIVNRFKYNGHILFMRDSGTVCELKEFEDHLEVSDVTGDYFNMPTGFTISTLENIFATESDILVYTYYYDLYVYDSKAGTWTQLNTSVVFDNQGWYRPYVVTGDCTLGGIGLPNPNTFNITNWGDTFTKTVWKEVGVVAVDLTSDQGIRGNKTFNSQINAFGGIMTNDLSGGYGQTLNIRAPEGSVNFIAPKYFTLNNSENIATTDKCIVNRSYSYPGGRYNGVTAAPDLYYNRFFKTPSGRIIWMDENGAYEFNGTQFVQLQSVTTLFTMVDRGQMITSEGLFVVDNNQKLYKWDDVNSDFVYIIDCPDNQVWVADSTTIRCIDIYKLVNNGGTYEWVNDTITNYIPGIKTLKIGQTYYYTSDINIYTYDELTKTFTSFGQIVSYPDNNVFFTYDNCLCYFSSNMIHKVDPTKVGTDDFDVQTGWFNVGYYNVAIEYDSKLYIGNGNVYPNNFGYTYDVTETVPAVPQADGTYTLKATVLNGQVTYSWVADV